MPTPTTNLTVSSGPALNPDVHRSSTGSVDAVDTESWLYFSKVVAITVTPVLSPIAYIAKLAARGISSTGTFILAAANYCHDYFFNQRPSDNEYSEQQKKLASRKITQVENERCGICLSDISPQYIQLDCKHVFDHECIKTHFNTIKDNSFTPPDLYGILPQDLESEFNKTGSHYHQLATEVHKHKTPVEIFLEEQVRNGRLKNSELIQILEMRASNERAAKEHLKPEIHSDCPICLQETKAFIAYRNFEDGGVPHAVREFRPPYLFGIPYVGKWLNSVGLV